MEEAITRDARESFLERAEELTPLIAVTRMTAASS
jgi:hypothetical protein